MTFRIWLQLMERQQFLRPVQIIHICFLENFGVNEFVIENVRVFNTF